MCQSTKQQISILSEFMEKHSDLAKSYNATSSSGRTTQRHLWEKLANMLNSNGPPTKTVAEWKRVWTLRKYSTKKKLTHNKMSIKKTGGGPFDVKPLDETEEAIINACGMEASVSGIEGGMTLVAALMRNEENVLPTVEELLEDLHGTHQISEDIPQPQETPKIPSSKKVRCEENILKKQLDLQEQFFSQQIENANKANKTLVEIRDAIRELSENRKNLTSAANCLKTEELEIRRQELEVAKLANEIKLMEINSK